MARLNPDLVQVRRIYEDTTATVGSRVLVDRIWPRGVSRERAHLDAWIKDVAPSAELRKWYHANPQAWDEFRQKYHQELDRKEDAVSFLLDLIKKGGATLLYSSTDTERNNAIALRDYLVAKLEKEK